MSKFHINSKGVPAPCHAKKGNCPFGGADSHYDNLEDAQKGADMRNEKNHGILPQVQDLPTEREIRMMKFQEIEISLKDGTKLKGVSEGIVKDSVGVRVDGNYDLVDEVSMDDIAEIKTSSDKIFKDDYNKDIKSRGVPKPKYRFNKTNLEAYTGKFIQVNYDGKAFGGKVIDTHYEAIGKNGLVIQSEAGEIKHIKDHRLDNIETTGSNYKEHKQIVKLRELEDEIQDKVLVKYDSEPEYSEFTEFTSADEKIDKYFESVIENKKGSHIDLDETNYDWVDEVEESRAGGSYDDFSMYQNDFNKGGGQYADWTDASHEAYEDDLDKAHKVNEFFTERKKAINDMVKEVESVDWTPYYDSQSEGEIEALKHLRNINMATDI